MNAVPSIAVLAGDGIGPEIVAEAVKVLEALRGPTFQFEIKAAPVGAARTCWPDIRCPSRRLRVAQAADAVLFGAVGDPRFDHLEPALRPERAILGLRRELGLFAGLKQVSVPLDLASLSPLQTRGRRRR